MPRKKAEPVIAIEEQPEIQASEDAPQPAPEVNQEPEQKQPEPEPKKESLIYVGPTLPSGQLSRYTVLKDGVKPFWVEELLQECKALKFLFVPVSKLGDTQKRLSDSSSIESSKWAEVRKHFSKGVN